MPVSTKQINRADFPPCQAPKDGEVKMFVGYTCHGTVENFGYCGIRFFGDLVHCNPCLKYYRAKYPQGWDSYPGDTCKHGVYTGGCGIDWMCGRCELGED